MNGAKLRSRYGFVLTFTVESRPRATKNGADTPECAPGYRLASIRCSAPIGTRSSCRPKFVRKTTASPSMSSVVKYAWFATIAMFTASRSSPMTIMTGSLPAAPKTRTASAARGKNVNDGQSSPRSGRIGFIPRV